MRCTTKSCKYYVYDECIRKNVTIDKGVCPFYSEEPLTVADIFHYPVHGVWGLSNPLGEELVVQGHVLDAVVAWGDDSKYTLVRPLKGYTRGLTTPHKDGIHDLTMYLRFIDSSIFELYLEDFLLDYLQGSKYTIDKIDCSGQFVHAIVRG